MARPNSPKDEPGDFSFLNSQPETSPSDFAAIGESAFSAFENTEAPRFDNLSFGAPGGEGLSVPVPEAVNFLPAEMSPAPTPSAELSSTQTSHGDPVDSDAANVDATDSEQDESAFAGEDAWPDSTEMAADSADEQWKSVPDVHDNSAPEHFETAEYADSLLAESTDEQYQDEPTEDVVDTEEAFAQGAIADETFADDSDIADDASDSGQWEVASSDVEPEIEADPEVAATESAAESSAAMAVEPKIVQTPIAPTSPPVVRPVSAVPAVEPVLIQPVSAAAITPAVPPELAVVAVAATSAASQTSPPSTPRAKTTAAPQAQSQPQSKQKLPNAEKTATTKPKLETASTSKASATKTASPALMGYAIAITLLFLFLVVTGRVSLFGHHALESLPDLRPLAPNEFRRVPDGTPVPDGHVLKLGESRRFGDVVLTPMKVTREPLTFQGFLTGQPEETLTTTPVLKLWLKFENRSRTYGFPPYDAGLMSNRTPPISSDESTLANSFLSVSNTPDSPAVRVLNYLQTMDSNFVLTGQNSAKVIMPEETLETFIACSEDIDTVGATGDSQYTWRVHFRKGVNESSGNGVTTLVDVKFSGSEIN